MKYIYATCIAILLLLASVLPAQNRTHAILVRTGTITAKTDISQRAVDSFNSTAPRYQGKTLAVFQFRVLPSAAMLKILTASNIQLHDYIGDRVYIASINGKLQLAPLQQAGCTAFNPWLPAHKLETTLARKQFPAHAIKMAGTIDVQVNIPAVFSIADAEIFLLAKNITIVAKEWSRFGQLTLRIATTRLEELASFPFIEYIQSVLPDPEPLNQNDRELSRANVLNGSIANGGNGLNGEGVVIGIGDIGDPASHIDFTGRLISRTSLTGAHGVHVSGIATGAGLLNEQFRGYAPKARMISESQSNILVNTALYVHDYGMVVTNNSYGGTSGCEYNGMYDLNSRTLDQLSLEYPEVLHVFAAGNSGLLTCLPYAPGFNTLVPGFQSAKNALTVGATNDLGEIGFFSSKGPSMDGRIKPEITTMGQLVVSTWSNNIYSSNNGTSMAAPGATAGAALLYQRYRQLHNGSNPRSAFIKALLCNGANDMGNPGPDYTYGFGSMNLVRSLDMLDQQHYVATTVANGATNNHAITVPANTAKLKVMLYWNDPVGSPLNRQTLVNDLDAEIVTPANTTRLPFILDTVVANINNNATTGPDHINNVEQLVIDNPAAGNYTVKVKGTAIAQGASQDYYLVYDIVPVSLHITYPIGGEGMGLVEQVKISWDAYGNPTNTFNLEYSDDNGNSWVAIASNIAAELRAYTWQVPFIGTSTAIIRVSQNGTGLSSMSRPFTIVGLPEITLSPVQCEGSVLIQWNPIPYATDYEVMWLRADSMQTTGITTSTNWHFAGLSRDSVYWVTVRARINGKPGRRAIAISRQPNNGNCSLPVFDNDLKLDSILSPSTGRRLTSIALTATQVLRIRIKNLDDAPANGCTVSYRLNNGPWVTENINAVIGGGAVYDHSFATTVDMSAIGSYNLAVVVKNNTTDPATYNDTLYTVIRQLDNQPLGITMTQTFLDDLETATDVVYRTETTGLTGVDRYDFENLTSYGELHTFFNTGVAWSGNRCFNIGDNFSRPAGPRGLNMITGTFNMTGKTVAANDVRLDFRYIVGTAITGNDVWIRGSDTDTWIKAFDFVGNATTFGAPYKLSPSIEVGDSLAAYGQEFSSSFQVRWRESLGLPRFLGGRKYCIDDIRLYEVQQDMQLVKIDNPVTINCGLNATTPVLITIHNSANAALTNVPVKYLLNNSNWVTEIIPSIAANTRMQYQFTQTINLASPGVYELKTLVDYPGDTYRVNDTAVLRFTNMPLINSFPYVQNFETGNGGWYTEGANSSWEYGIPASPNINRAASGNKAWKTKLSGNYNESEYSFLYSPCIQLNGMTKATLSFSVAMSLDGCHAGFCDYVAVEYSTNGTTWLSMGSLSYIINWYNTGFSAWSDYKNTRWHVATAPLPVTSGPIRIRFVMQGDAFLSDEGVAIDDIHVYDNTKGIYTGASMPSPVGKQVSGNQWIDFEADGKLIASIHPNGQNLGVTDVQAYANAGAVRYAGSQYYHDRNITIKPAVAPTDSISLRFYYDDSLTNRLIDATGCTLCTKPINAYTLGVSTYSNANRTLENGTIDDNATSGNWSFIHPSVVPFDKGYYAEFKVKNLSEFWLNNGGLDTSSAIPSPVFAFTAQRVAGTDVLLQWKTGVEAGIVKYEIELSRGNTNQFEKTGEVTARLTGSNQQYVYLDREADKFGARYYRIRIVYANGSFTYSVIRMVLFNNAVLGTLYPNPSTGLFNMVVQLPAGKPIEGRIINMNGQVIKNYRVMATGFPQTLLFDLSSEPAGVYLLQLNEEAKGFKLFKQ